MQHLPDIPLYLPYKSVLRTYRKVSDVPPLPASSPILTIVNMLTLTAASGWERIRVNWSRRESPDPTSLRGRIKFPRRS